MLPKNELMEAAEYWVFGLGVAVLPVAYRAKRPDGQALKQGGYVLNGTPEWQRLKTELPTEEALRLWFGGPMRNIGVVTGWQGLAVIDFDNRASYDAWAVWARQAPEPAPTVEACTYRVQSARGVHVYVATEEPVQPHTVGNIDIKAAGGYVLAPPSVHPTGARYAGDDMRSILRVERLADVFPFQPVDKAPPAAAHTEQTSLASNPASLAASPWDWRPGQAGASICEIKARVSLLSLIPDAKSTSGDGRWWIAHCPFHDDHAPSLWIDAQHGICNCHAGCARTPMDVINFYARLHGCDTSTAMQALAHEVRV